MELVALGPILGAGLLWLNRHGPSPEETATSFATARVLPSLLTARCVTAAGISLLADAGGGLLWTVPRV